MISDLRSYVDYLDRINNLIKVGYEVSPELEITAFTDKAGRSKRYDSKALLFEKVSGYDMKVATNLFGSITVLRELFSNTYANEILANFNRIKSNTFTPSMIKGAKALMNSKPKVSQLKERHFRQIDSLDELPILKVWPKDAGKFITLPLVVTRSPIDGSLNVGVYRMQVYDGETTGMHWQAQKGGAIHASQALGNGEELKVSVAIGTDPYNVIAAIAPLPHGINEFSISGVARNSKTMLMQYMDYPPVPENADIVLYGKVDPKEKRKEGPFGDHNGYYSIPQEYPVFHIEKMYAKKKAIYPASVVGFSWHEDVVVGQFLFDYFKPIIKSMNESIVDIYLPPEGAFTGMCFVSIKKRFPGEAKKIMFSVLGTGQLSLTKIIAVFDEDIDIRDTSKVMWALSTRVEPQRDIQIIEGTVTDSLDHTTNLPDYGSKLLIDATKKIRGESYSREWPDTISLPEELVSEVERKWVSLKK